MTFLHPRHIYNQNNWCVRFKVCVQIVKHVQKSIVLGAQGAYTTSQHTIDLILKGTEINPDLAVALLFSKSNETRRKQMVTLPMNLPYHLDADERFVCAHSHHKCKRKCFITFKMTHRDFVATGAIIQKCTP